MKPFFPFLIALFLTVVFHNESMANTQNQNSPQPPLTSESYPLLAQYEEDAFDPFADYSEFEEGSEEEADINFFKNGRFFSLGFLGGVRGMTGNLGQITTSSTSFGLFLSYFFDLRFALQFAFITGEQKYKFTTPVNKYNVNATSSLSSFAIDVKYYFNTQNVTKGLANLNPYLISGFSQITRTAVSTDQLDVAKDTALGFELGFGIEFPMLQHSMYGGLQASFYLVNFRDEATEIVVQGEQTGIYPSGDLYSVFAVIGVNF